MVGIAYQNNHDLDQPEIVNLLVTGFSGTLRGYIYIYIYVYIQAKINSTITIDHFNLAISSISLNY